MHDIEDANGQLARREAVHAAGRDGSRPDRPGRGVRSPALRILAALVLGLVLGTALAPLPAGETLARLLAPVGQLWLNALTMTVVPLVFSLLVSGIAGAARAASGGTVAARALLCFALALLAAAGMAAIVTPLLLGLTPLPAAAGTLRPDGVVPAVTSDAASWIANLVPTNPVQAAAEGAMVPLVVFALLFGAAMGRIGHDQHASLDRLFRAVIETMLVIVQWLLRLAPLGILALAYGVGVRLGAGVASVLLHYVLIVIAICLATTIGAVLAVWALSSAAPARFLRAAFPAQTIAVSTQSSLASLPAMIAAARPLRVDRDDAGIVLPMAVAMFKAASAAANVAVAVYLAQLHGVTLTPWALAVGAVVAAAVSIGAVGLPAQVSFFAVIAPVCAAMGVPLELLPVLLAIESIPDIFRTLGNVTADLAVLRIVAREAGPE